MTPSVVGAEDGGKCCTAPPKLAGVVLRMGRTVASVKCNGDPMSIDELWATFGATKKTPPRREVHVMD